MRLLLLPMAMVKGTQTPPTPMPTALTLTHRLATHTPMTSSRLMAMIPATTPMLAMANTLKQEKLLQHLAQKLPRHLLHLPGSLARLQDPQPKVRSHSHLRVHCRSIF